MRGNACRCTLRSMSSRVRMLSTQNVHQTAVKGFTAESAAIYDSGRPTYNNESLDRVLELLFSAKVDYATPKVLELGAGTGKFSESFLKYAKNPKVLKQYPVLNHLEYIATEPSKGFRESLKQSLPKIDPAVKIDTALGDKIPFRDQTLDGVIAAQAFHWMANLNTLKEIHRVLVLECPFIMLWNSYDYSYEWLRQIDKEILTPAYGNDVPRQQNGKWEDCFNTDAGRSLFSLVSKWQGKNVQVGDAEMVVNRFMSTSVIVEKNDAERAEIETKIRHIIANHPELTCARRTGRYEIHYITELAWVHKHA